ASHQTGWRPVPGWSKEVRINSTSPAPPRVYVWGRWGGIRAVPSGYDDADLVTRLTEDDVEWLPEVRPATLDLKIRVLGVLHEAAVRGTAEGLWERCLGAVKVSFGGVETVKRLLRIDSRYAGYNALSGPEERDEVSCIPGGL